MGEKFYSLQIVRAIAAILVVLYHSSGHFGFHHLRFLGNKFYMGYAGVDLFFVLSGFIIAYSSSHLIGQRNQTWEFLKRRAIRIYPSYWLLLFTPLILIYLFLPQFISEPQYYQFSSLLQNFLLVFDHPEMCQVTWTLSHELYFYLLFGLLIFSGKMVALVATVLAVSIINAFTGIIGISLFENRIVNSLFSPLNIEFALGVLAFYWLKNRTLKADKVIFAIGMLSFLVVSFYFALTMKNMVGQFRHFFFGIPSFLIISSLISLERRHPIKKNLFVKIGNASYVLYLIHLPFINAWNMQLAIPRRLVIINEEITSLVGLILIVIISIYVHQLIEKPLLSFLNNSSSTLSRLNSKLAKFRKYANMT